MRILERADPFFLPSRDFEPAYLALHRSGELQRRAQAAVESLHECRVCPRDCGVNRFADKTAACKTGRYAVVGSYFPHFGEEDCLRGWNGSGTIFFSWCNLRCVFCFHPDTFVSTDRGTLRIAEIFEAGKLEQPLNGGSVRFGDGSLQAITREGRPAKIAKMFRHPFSGDLIKVKPFNCPSLLLTPNHQVFAAVKSAPEKIVKVPAADLTRDHYLLVPKRQPGGGSDIVLKVDEVLSRHAATRRTTPVRVAAATLANEFAQPLTSHKLADITGYHPAYVRKLRGQWKQGRLRADTEAITMNELVIEDSLVRFQTEKRPGIPVCLNLDERLAWLLGFYCAEGHVTSPTDRPNSHRLVFSFGHHELSRAETVSRWLEELFGVSPATLRRRTTFTVETGKASLAVLFAVLCGRNSHEKRVPEVVLQSPLPIIQAYLNGVAAGDGCDRRTHLVINTVSESFAHGLFEVGLRLGNMPSIHRWLPEPKRKIEGREVRQAPLYYIKFPKINPLTGGRHTRWSETERGYLVPIHKIERKHYEGPVYNLEIDDPDHSYVASYVAVSNCQNYDISQVGEGLERRPAEIARMMLELQAEGCHNINFVTPEHVVPQVLEALVIAVEGGLRLPLVYNTSAYDSMDSLRRMDGVVDIYMPDFKFWDAQRSLRYLKAKDYAEAARRAIKEMHRQVGALKLDERGLAQRGVLVRHLVMPGHLADTEAIMRFLADEVSPDTYVNVMAQYYPAGKVNAEKYPELNRRLGSGEHAEAVRIAQQTGLWRLDERRQRIWLRM
jgi:putative pyruvate formate lyase activating enzyme